MKICNVWKLSALASLFFSHAAYSQPVGEVPSGMSAAEVESYQSSKPYNELLPAETYGYPDPRRVVEWQIQLELTDEQLKKLRPMANRIGRETALYGKKIIANERLLDDFFRKGETDPMALANRVESIGLLRWRLRFNLLSICVSTRAILTEAQLKTYRELRNSSPGGGAAK